MASYNNHYKTKFAENQAGRIEQLLQLVRIVWDGDIINKSARDELIRLDLAQRVGNGFNLITEKGVTYLNDLGLIHP